MNMDTIPASALPTEDAPQLQVDASAYFQPPPIVLDPTDVAGGAPTGRVAGELRDTAQTQDGKRILKGVARDYARDWRQYGQIAATAQQVLTARTQLAVTGARAFAACPGFAAAGLQVTDPIFEYVPAPVAQGFLDQMETDYTAALDAVRNPLAGINPARAELGWIAVSGEDDSPDFPVNVKIAPFPQFHVTVTVPTPALGEGTALDVKVRYFVASAELPSDPPSEPFFPTDDEVILYIHGEGSRAEEALDFIDELHKHQAENGRSFTVVSLDLPGFGYSTTTGATPAHTDVSPMPEPAVAFGEVLIGSPPSPDLLDFIEATIVEFVADVITPAGNPITAVMGGSLGGHMALRFAASDLDWVKNVVAWSPAGVWQHDFSVGIPVSVTLSQTLLTVPALIKRMQPPGTNDAIFAARSNFINLVWYQDTFAPPLSGADALGIAAALVASGMVPFLGEELTGWLSDLLPPGVLAAAAIADLLSGLVALPTVPKQPEMWYRDDWPGPGSTNNQAKIAAMQEDLYDRQEIYNENFRAWHWRICMDCLVYTFEPSAIQKPLLLMVGQSDEYPLVNFASSVPSFAGGIGSPGLGHIVADTGHSIHNERPLFLATELMNFAPPGNVFAAEMAPAPIFNHGRNYAISVTNAQTRLPVPGATVVLLNEANGITVSQSTTTDSHGVATFDSVTLETTTVVVGTHPPYHSVTLRPSLRLSAMGFAPAMFVLWPGHLTGV